MRRPFALGFIVGAAVAGIAGAVLVRLERSLSDIPTGWRR